MNNILNGSKSIFETEQDEKDYVPFLINRGLSQHVDSIFYANEMNINHHLTKKMQYDYLFRSIRKMKRGFGKWAKSEKSEDIELIQRAYKCSERKAKEISRMFPKIGNLLERYGDKK
jgi:hypothetical protein